MPLEVKGQCEICKRDKYKYLKTFPSIKRDRVQKVYNNPQWSKVRLEAIKRANGLCEICYAKGILREGKEVHHIVKVSKGNNNTNYDLNNLVYVCTSCHRKIESIGINEIIKFLTYDVK